MSGKAWTYAEIAAVIARYPNEVCAVLAKDLGRTESAVHQFARKLGISKSNDFFTSSASGRLTGERSKASRFQPGHATWNKGIKGLDIGGKATRFKQGNKPQTLKPIGSERLNKEGMLVRKISDTGNRKADWVLVHQLVWKQHNGPIPKGFAIAMKDGNKANIVIENLECISRAELMRRNTVHRLPKELAQLAQLRGALNRQINKREKGKA